MQVDKARLDEMAMPNNWPQVLRDRADACYVGDSEGTRKLLYRTADYVEASALRSTEGKEIGRSAFTIMVENNKFANERWDEAEARAEAAEAHVAKLGKALDAAAEEFALIEMRLRDKQPERALGAAMCGQKDARAALTRSPE